MLIQRQKDMLVDYPQQQETMWGLERCSVGIFWLLIAASLLLSLCENTSWGRIQRDFPIGWSGVFVVYYALRSTLMRPIWREKSSQQTYPLWHAARGLPCMCVVDLCVISLLISLSGGWASPLYLLYFGWAITLVAEPSWVYRMLVSVLAPLFLVGAVILAASHSLSAEQTAVTLEHLLLIVGVCLGASALRMYFEWAERCWAVERQQWKLLRHTVFSQLSHELVTPLSAVKISTALLAEEAEGGHLVNEQGRQLVEVIGRNCARMSLLLTELLELWRSGQPQLSGALRSMECLPVAQELAQMLQPLFEAKQQKCVVVVEPPAVAVLAHKRRLEQVLVNLLSNAQKYAPIHTSILLKIKEEQEVVQFAVRDEGPGIPYADQRYLFDLTSQGARPVVVEGSARLGLALAKALVFAQGGRIWVESRPGQGSTFYFTLPRAPLEEEYDAHSVS